MKLLQKLTIFIIMLIMSTSSVFAQASFGSTFKNLEQAGNKGYNTKDVTETSLASTLGTLVQTAISLLGIVFTILIIYAGLIWMTAGGDDQKITKARGILKNSVIGLAIVLLSLVITNFIFASLQGVGTTASVK